ncbi:MAG: hypothetical protein HYY40_10975 [Bacteroidetes bacterium]|nr:hypothetical protein [Bacteroidota bacterium]
MAQTNVTQEWVRPYNGTAGGGDGASGIVTDGQNNVIICGTSEGIGTGYDIIVVKYDGAGNIIYEVRYNDTISNGDDRAAKIAADEQDNVYVCGSTVTASGNDDFITIKIDPQGNILWISTYDNGGNDNGMALAVTAAGVVVAGDSEGDTTGSDIALVQYDASGTQQWISRYDGSGGDDNVAAVAVDGAGNIFISGMAEFLSTHMDYVTLKYDASGNELWMNFFNGADNGYDRATALALDTAGNPVVTGYSFTATSGMNMVTIKYDASSGATLWVSEYNGPANVDDGGFAIACDKSGNTIVTGFNFTLIYLYHDFVTIKYNFYGDSLWIRRYNGAGNSNDLALAMALDDSDNVYVTGYNFTLVAHDYATIKYTPDGTQQWVMNYDGGGRR